jgi:hypothetical protein
MEEEFPESVAAEDADTLAETLPEDEAEEEDDEEKLALPLAVAVPVTVSAGQESEDAEAVSVLVLRLEAEGDAVVLEDTTGLKELRRREFKKVGERGHTNGVQSIIKDGPRNIPHDDGCAIKAGALSQIQGQGECGEFREFTGRWERGDGGREGRRHARGDARG